MPDISLPLSLEERLAAAATAMGRDKDALACDAIAEFLDDLEDGRIASERLAEVTAGRMDVVTLEELGRDLGLAD